LLAFVIDITVIAALYPLAHLFFEGFLLQNIIDGGFSFIVAFLLGNIYFIGSTMVLKKQTMGMAVVKISMHSYEGGTFSGARLLFRHLLFLLWFPGTLMVLEVAGMEEPYISFLYLAVFVILGAGLLHMGISLNKRERRLIHERISKTFLKSLN